MRYFLVFLFLAVLSHAEIFVGARYGQITQDSKFNDIKTDEKRAQGGGFVVGYASKEYRLIIAHDAPAYKKPAKTSITSFSTQLVTEDTEGTRGFLGLTYARMSYVHGKDPQQKSIALDFVGCDIGLILLDERFPKTQMELGARYLSSTNLPSELEMKPNLHFYLGLNFLFF